MSLWKIYHHPSSFNAEHKQGISQAVTKIYAKLASLPEFYAVVIFQPIEDIYRGGVIDTKFVRISINHIARPSEEGEYARLFQGAIDAALKPFIADRGLKWEYNYSNEPRLFWKINGLIPPETGSDEEKTWLQKNEPVPPQ